MLPTRFATYRAFLCLALLWRRAVLPSPLSSEESAPQSIYDKVCQGAEAPTDANRCLVLYPGCLMCPGCLLAYSCSYRCSNSPWNQTLRLRFIWHLAGDWRDVTSQRHWALSCDPGVIHVWRIQPLLTLFMLRGWPRELRCTTQRSHMSYEPLNLWRGWEAFLRLDSVSPLLPVDTTSICTFPVSMVNKKQSGPTLPFVPANAVFVCLFLECRPC